MKLKKEQNPTKTYDELKTVNKQTLNQNLSNNESKELNKKTFLKLINP